MSLGAKGLIYCSYNIFNFKKNFGRILNHTLSKKRANWAKIRLGRSAASIQP